MNSVNTAGGNSPVSTIVNYTSAAAAARLSSVLCNDEKTVDPLILGMWLSNPIIQLLALGFIAKKHSEVITILNGFFKWSGPLIKKHTSQILELVGNSATEDRRKVISKEWKALSNVVGGVNKTLSLARLAPICFSVGILVRSFNSSVATNPYRDQTCALNYNLIKTLSNIVLVSPSLFTLGQWIRQLLSCKMDFGDSDSKGGLSKKMEGLEEFHQLVHFEGREEEMKDEEVKRKISTLLNTPIKNSFLKLCNIALMGVYVSSFPLFQSYKNECSGQVGLLSQCDSLSYAEIPLSLLLGVMSINPLFLDLSLERFISYVSGPKFPNDLSEKSVVMGSGMRGESQPLLGDVEDAVRKFFEQEGGKGIIEEAVRNHQRANTSQTEGCDVATKTSVEDETGKVSVTIVSEDRSSNCIVS